MYVPSCTILLFLKLKAAWDRNYRIEHNTGEDPDLDKSKLIKDYADILSLFDKYPFLLQTFLKTCMTSQGYALFDESGICHFHAKSKITQNPVKDMEG